MGIRPVPEQYPVTQSFYEDKTQYNVNLHGAIDFGCPEGVDVVAIDSGTVVHADWAWALPADSWESRYYQIRPEYGDQRTGGGIMVIIDHGPYVSVTAHLSETRLNSGTAVVQGQVIGKSGNTGSSTGAHVHLAVLPKPFDWDNTFYGGTDPAPYITGKYRKITTETTLAKQYKHETQWTTKNQVERSFYGFGPKPTGITIHHFGEPGQKFENVCHFLSTNNVPTSAHYVVEDGRIATLAVPEMATYHCGHTIGNGTTIGIECRPECTKGDVDTVVQLVYELEQTYGSMLMYEHKHWFPTACAGTWGAKIPEIIERVNAMHKNGGRDPKLSSKPAPAPKPAPKPEPPKVTPQTTGSTPVKADPPSPAEINPTGYDVWAYKNARFEDRDAYAILRGIAADVTDIKSKLEEK